MGKLICLIKATLIAPFRNPKLPLSEKSSYAGIGHLIKPKGNTGNSLFIILRNPNEIISSFNFYCSPGGFDKFQLCIHGKKNSLEKLN